MSDLCLIVNLHYGGSMEYKDNRFSYKGGDVKPGLDIDPDYMTWSMFEAFCKKNGSLGEVDEVYYKLPEEDMDCIRGISGDVDEGIRRMCSLGSTVGEVDIFIDQDKLSARLTEREGEGQDYEGVEVIGEEDRVEADGKQPENEGVEAEGSEEEVEGLEAEDVEEEVVEDQEHVDLFDQIEEEIAKESGGVHMENTQDDGEANDQGEADDEGESEDEGEAEGEVDNGLQDELEEEADISDVEDDIQRQQREAEEELERQCVDADHPLPAVDTDEEWFDFNRRETQLFRKKLRKEKPPYLWLGQSFCSRDEFKDQLLRYVLKTQYDVRLCRWEATRLKATCTKKNCKWKIYCAVESPKGDWMVKTFYRKHNHVKTGRARMLKQGVIGLMYKDEARRRPNIRWTDIKDEIMQRYKITVSKFICQKARRVALDMVIETQKLQFAKLWDYEAELKRSNPNITTEIVTIPREDGKEVFDRFYICFEQLRNSWKKCCRPIIGLDGAFLKWELKGEVLAAIGRDADNRIYPIAWAIVRVEDNDSWGWFIQKLKDDLDLGFGNGYSIISDKQKGLINAVQEKLPNAEHRHCARPIFANWKKVYGKSEYEQYFWDVAYSSTEGDYEYNLEALKEFDHRAYEDLLKVEPKSWCRAFLSPEAKCQDICNNLSGSFNKTIKEARQLPMIDMLEEIRRLAMKRISRRRVKTSRCKTQFPPNIMEIFEMKRIDSSNCNVLTSGENLYEVLEQGGSFEVNLRYKHCACNQWNITGIPCRHAIYVINELNRDPANDVDSSYFTPKWQETYTDNIRPVNGERLWKKTGKDPIQIPDKRRMPGRPKNYARIKEPHESKTNPTKMTREGRKMHCSNCRQSGHTRPKCPNPPAQVDPPRKRGRPKKISAAVDPWTIQNVPKRRYTMSQPTVASRSTPSDPHPSTAPAVAPSSRGRGVVRGRGVGRGVGRGRGRGCGRGRGRATEPPIPAGYGCYISPFTGKMFEVFGSTAKDLSGPP